MHEVFNLLFLNRLIFPPVSALRRVLECGFGAGSWAIDVATQYPDCEVCDLTALVMFSHVDLDNCRSWALTYILICFLRSYPRIWTSRSTISIAREFLGENQCGQNCK